MQKKYTNGIYGSGGRKRNCRGGNEAIEALEKSVCEQCFDEIQDEELDEYDDLQMKL